MHTKRIIPCLDVRNGNVVKGVNFVGIKEIGDPVQLGEYYYKQGADELVFFHDLPKIATDAMKEEVKNAILTFSMEV